MRQMFNRIGLMLAFLVAFTLNACADPLSPTPKFTDQITASTAGFDEYGYNEIAGIFVGPADGLDRVNDGLYYGSPSSFTNDHLVMKWSKGWPSATGAWLTNEWNGQVPGGSGEVWHYKIVNTGSSCGADGTPIPGGAYCIWGTYAVVMSQGSVDNQHFWDAHAVPGGFGRG